MYRPPTRVAGVVVALLGLVVVAGMAGTALAVDGRTPHPPAPLPVHARLAADPADPPPRLPATTPPAPAPSELAAAARAERTDATTPPSCATTRPVGPAEPGTQAVAPTPDDKEVCPQSRGSATVGPP